MLKRILLSLGILVLVVMAFFTAGISAPTKASAAARPGFSFGGKTYPTYVVHGIPGVPVDVYVNGKLTIPNFQPGTTAGPFNLPVGAYMVALYPVDADSTTAQPIIRQSVVVFSNSAPVTIIARLDFNGKPTIQSIFEFGDFLDVPGDGMIVVRNASNVYPDFLNSCIAPVGTPFGFYIAGPYLPAGQYNVAILPFGSFDCNKPLATTVVTVKPEVNTNVYLVGDAKAGTLSIITQDLPDQGNGL